MAAFARLPKAPQVIEGVLNFRGAAVPVLDIRTRFGLPLRPVRTTDHLIVARAGKRIAAIRVDRVSDLIEARPRISRTAIRRRAAAISPAC